MKNSLTNFVWQILYNFAAQTGDHWTNSFFYTTSSPTTAAINYTTEVTAVGTRTLVGKIVKELSVKYNSNTGDYSTATITEHIGCTNFLFNYRGKGVVEGNKFYSFICYSDSIIGLKKYTSMPCDFENPVGLYEFPNMGSYLVYPDPFTTELSIEKDDLQIDDLELTFMNLAGREVKKETIQEGHKINTSSLSPGMYFLQIIKDKELVYKTKIIKQN